MATVRTWRKLLGATLVALVVAMVSLGPSLDAVMCGGEGGAVAAELAHATVDSPDAPADQHDPGAPCVHGHCHHVASVAASATVEAKPMIVAHADPAAVEASLPYSNLKFALKRPPRA